MPLGNLLNRSQALSYKGVKLVLFLIGMSYASLVFSQPFDLNSSNSLASDNLNTAAGPQAELHIGRVIFGESMSNGFGRGRGRAWWSIDWPEAEAHITNGVERMSLIEVAGDSRHIRLDDPYLYDYPWLFLQQIGQASFSIDEIDALREYLLRGGFVLIDDFHGPQRQNLVNFATQLFPDRPLIPIPIEDVVMSIHYDLNQDTQIPGSRHLRGSNTSGEVVAQMEGEQEWLGIYDDLDNLVLAAHVNMDMGDAWQHANDPYYPEPMTNLAYRFGVNYFIYAMTH